MSSSPSDSVQVILQNGANSASVGEGEANTPSLDKIISETQPREALPSVEEEVLPSTNGHTASVPGNSYAEEEEVHLPSIQSPASALADTLSSLSLATPAVKGYKASRLQAVTDQHDSASETAAQEPANGQEGDIPVGLVYDKIMEEHVGPPSKLNHCAPSAR